ncbi:adenylate kinase-domain-containing protein, partial [Zopfochytrium polystomum]
MDILLDREKIEAFAAYADRHELFDLFDALLSRLLIEKPADPLAWMIDALQKPEVPSIVICGPPSSGVASLCARVAQLYDCIHISTSALLQTAIERQTSLGNQAKPFIERGELVPDAIMLSLVTQRLEEPDAVTKGFVLDGFPRTREQAFAMQMRGLVVDHFVIIEIPDAVIIDRALQTRVDPLTKKLYHLTNNPPPARDADLLARLIHRRNDQEPQVRSRLAQYRRHLPAVATCFKKTARWVSSTACLEDGTPPTEKVVADVTAWVGTRRRTRAPRMFKILLQGLPGSGKSSVAKMVEERLGFVHVSPEKIVQEEVSSRSVWANELSPFIHKPDEVPSNIMSDLVIRRLKRPDCVQKGWILEGFPNTRQDADFLASHDIVPNRVIWLDASPETCLARLAHRRYDPTTGRPVNLLA